MFSNVLQRNSNAISAEATSNFVVYSCIFSSFAGVSITSYFPILHVSAYDLRVACQDAKWNFGLRGIEVCYEV